MPLSPIAVKEQKCRLLPASCFRKPCYVSSDGVSQFLALYLGSLVNKQLVLGEVFFEGTLVLSHKLFGDTLNHLRLDSSHGVKNFWMIYKAFVSKVILHHYEASLP